MKNFNYLILILLIAFCAKAENLISFSFNNMRVCPEPGFANATFVTANSAELGWLQNGGVTNWDIEFGVSGFTQTGIPTHNDISENPFLITSLNPETEYQYYVRADCNMDNTSDVSAWIGPIVFTTASLPPENDECSNATNLVTQIGTTGLNTISGTTSFATQSLPDCIGSADDDVWYSFEATNATHHIIIFNTGGNLDIVTEVFDACGGTSLTCQDDPDSPIILTGLTVSNTYYFRLYTFRSGYSTDFNISIGTPLSCPVPIDLNAENMTETTADLSWVENGEATMWNIEWGESGFLLGSGTMEVSNLEQYMLSGLSSAVLYSYYVQSICGGGDLSDWAGPYSFLTPDPPPVCGGYFNDSGGETFDYGYNEQVTTTICPEVNGDVVSVSFTSFSTENNGTACFDGLTIYNGADTSAQTINPPGGGTVWCWDRDDATPTGSGDLQGLTITSTSTSGCLTFVFSSDDVSVREGWVASVGCMSLNTENLDLLGFSYYPNPVKNTLNINTTGLDQGFHRLYVRFKDLNNSWGIC